METAPTSEAVSGRVTPRTSQAGALRFVGLWLFLLVVSMLGESLFRAEHAVLSGPGQDVQNAFYGWRAFGFATMRSGHIPLWNPYVAAGTPFMGGWQSALLYPVNWIHFFLPVGLGINCEILLNTFLAGLGTALWALRNRLHPFAALFAGAIFMFSEPVFLNIYAGHLSELAAVAWTPFVLLATDAILDRPNMRWAFLGACAFAMQLTAGHPQTVFNTLICAALYVALRLRKTPQKPRIVLLIAVAYGWGALMAAAQLTAGVAAATEGTRQNGVSYEYASLYALPVENLAVAAVPNPYGDGVRLPYWGRWNLWESTAYFGAVAFALTMFGVAYGQHPRRHAWMILALITAGFAVAPATPIFSLLYHFVPGFRLFRCHGRFYIDTVLFAAMLAGLGLDRLVLQHGRTRRFPIALAAITSVLAVLGTGLVAGAHFTVWPLQYVMRSVGDSGVSALGPEYYNSPHFMEMAQRFAGQRILACAVLLGMLALLMRRAATVRWAAYGIGFLGVAELFFVSHGTLATFDPAQSGESLLETALPRPHGDIRIIRLAVNPNLAVGTSVPDLRAYDSAVPARFCEFFAFTQGRSKPIDPGTLMPFGIPSGLLRLFRLRYVVDSGQAVDFGQADTSVMAIERPLPHALFVPRYVVAHSKDAVFAAMSTPDFDLTRTVVLESPPNPKPLPESVAGTVTVACAADGALTISLRTSTPGLLLITDSYSRHWKVVPLEGRQQRYQIMPADYCAMAIPLEAGQHAFRLEYSPDGFEPALIVSIIATVAAIIFGAWICGNRLHRHRFFAGTLDIRQCVGLS